MIAKIAKVLEVFTDYLIGEGKIAHYDKEVIRRIEDIQELDKDTQPKLFFLIDNEVQDFKTRRAFAFLGEDGYDSAQLTLPVKPGSLRVATHWGKRKTSVTISIEPRYVSPF